jgi:hypothetical protein
VIEPVMRARSVRALTLAFAFACSTSSSARAQEPSPPPEPRAVLVTVPDCLGAPGRAVKDLVALELAPRMRVIDASTEPVLSGSVRCAEDAPLVVLTVSDPARAEPLHVELDLAAAAPLARARLLALTLAELITTSQLEQPPPSSAPPAPPSDAGAQPEPDQPAGLRSSSALQLWLAPALSIAGAPATALLGADLGAAYALGPVLVVLDVEARFGQSDRTASEVSLRAFSAGAALMPLWIDGRGAQLSAGAGFRIGHIAMTGSSSNDAVAADQLSGVWLGPALLAALQLPLAGPSALRLALEGGYVARPVVGLDERGAERMVLRGPWLSASVGFALELL